MGTVDMGGGPVAVAVAVVWSLKMPLCHPLLTKWHAGQASHTLAPQASH